MNLQFLQKIKSGKKRKKTEIKFLKVDRSRTTIMEHQSILLDFLDFARSEDEEESAPGTHLAMRGGAKSKSIFQILYSNVPASKLKKK